MNEFDRNFNAWNVGQYAKPEFEIKVTKRKKLNKKNVIGYIAMCMMVLTVGIVGGMENEKIGMAAGTTISIFCSVTALILQKLVQA